MALNAALKCLTNIHEMGVLYQNLCTESVRVRVIEGKWEARIFNFV